MKCFVFAIGNLPDPILQPILAEGFIRFTKSLRGLIGIHPYYPKGTLMAFDTLENAVFARDRVIESGNEAANYIMNAEISEDGQTLTVHSPAKNCRQ